MRFALFVLHGQYGSWQGVAGALKSNKRLLTKLTYGERLISPAYALRIARLLGEPVSDIFSGAFQHRNECPSCGARIMNGRVAPPMRRGRPR